MKNVVLRVVTLLCAIGLAFSTATPPTQVNFQGVLRDTVGNPLSGNFDMEFHLFDSDFDGSEILADRHTIATVGYVVVSGGMFSVPVGSGSVVDGSGVFPGDPYLNLSSAFRDFSIVYLEIQIGPAGGTLETLGGRIRVVSAAYALNADHLDGLDSSQLARLGSSNTFTLGDQLIQTGGSGIAGLRVRGAPAQTGDLQRWEDSTGSALARVWSNGVIQSSAGFQGNGSGLTSLSLSGTYSTGVSFPNVANSFAGDGSGLAGLNAGQLALGTLPSGRLSGTYSSAVTFSNAANSFTGGGAGLTGVNAGLLDGIDSASFLRSDAADSYTGGTITFNSGTILNIAAGSTLDVNGTLAANGSIQVDGDGPDGPQEINFYEDGSVTGEDIRWDDLGDEFEVTDDFRVIGNLFASGAKPFVQNHPFRKDLSVVYVALEGDEAGTYTRGSGRLVNGEARVPLAETFAWVTNPDIGLTAQLTPRGKGPALYVESVDTRELVVKTQDGSPGDAAFDYLVMGLRIGYEEWGTVETRHMESPIPSSASVERRYTANPELRNYTALSRFRAMDGQTRGTAPEGLDAAGQLRAAIGEFDPDVPDSQADGAASPARGREASVSPEVEVGARRARFDSPGNPKSADSLQSMATSSPSQADGASTPCAGADPGTPFQDAEGNLYARSVRPAYGELAGFLPSSESVEAGDVVVIGPAHPGRILRGRREADEAVVGIVSGEPGLVLGSRAESYGGAGGASNSREERGGSTSPGTEGGHTLDGEPGAAGADAIVSMRDASRSSARIARPAWTDRAPVALSGIVPCKVDADFGAIRVGDLLTVSSTPGHAMRSVDNAPGTILGKALESLDSGKGVIRVLVMLR